MEMCNNQAVAMEERVKVPLAFSQALPTYKASNGELISKVWIVSEKKWLATPAPPPTRGAMNTGCPDSPYYAAHELQVFGLDTELGLQNTQTNADFIQAGHPSDLLTCAIRADVHRQAGPPPEEEQALNLLSNVLEETILTVPQATSQGYGRRDSRASISEFSIWIGRRSQFRQVTLTAQSHEHNFIGQRFVGHVLSHVACFQIDGASFGSFEWYSVIGQHNEYNTVHSALNGGICGQFVLFSSFLPPLAI
ncbi:hypothetical protein B0H14DRAFT_2639691 [Mycena olivaceomarginata]|nr:hypothetical protein B0H14DRAFT_2639691 [Mycena olivaceomarginata]